MIFVDFDDTLCLHRVDINSKEFLTKDGAYLTSVPNKPLINQLYELKADGNKLILLTMSSSFMLEHKKNWCNENCPNLFNDYVGLSIDCNKAEYIYTICNFTDENEIHIFIDDNREERHLVEKLNNVRVYSPQLFVIDKGEI